MSNKQNKKDSMVFDMFEPIENEMALAAIEAGFKVIADDGTYVTLVRDE